MAMSVAHPVLEQFVVVIGGFSGSAIGPEMAFTIRPPILETLFRIRKEVSDVRALNRQDTSSTRIPIAAPMRAKEWTINPISARSRQPMC
jgi:hypothetical protein